MSIHRSPISSDPESIKSKLSGSDLKYSAQKEKLREVTLPVFQTIKMHYTAAVDFRTYRLARHSHHFDDTVSSYVTKLVNMVRLQMKAQFFDPKDPNSNIEFYGNIQAPVWYKQNLQEEAMCVLHHCVKKTLASTLNSRACAQDRLTLLSASLRNKQSRSRKLLRSYPKVFNYPMKKYTTD